MLWVVEIYPKGRRGQQRESKLSGQPGGQAHWESWVRALRSVEVIGSNPQPLVTLTHFSLFLGPFPLFPLAHTSLQEMRTTWGISAEGPKGTSQRRGAL